MDQKPKCPICQGTGFSLAGKICPHITGKKLEGMPDIPDFFKDIFDDIFKGGSDGKKYQQK
uniref:Uncharacterized protein n=1 Tax=viral metagenome TaxID=1070528 RepID=A0A6M3JLX6_9ZZZZ